MNTRNLVNDERFMRRALSLAAHGRGKVHPNPLVGAVLVKQGRIIGEGAHEFFGGPHAEVSAISRASVSPKGATLYVTLEPCAHYGKTPPCVDMILRHGISRVVIASRDENPLVSGKGLRALRAAGVSVCEGLLRDQARRMNRDFNHWIKTHRPYVTAKIAQSLDGKIATKSGQSQWISGEESRKVFSQNLRADSDAILVGVGTVLADNPRLTVRLPGYRGRQPAKIVLDAKLRTPLGARLFQDTPRDGVIIIAGMRASAKQKAALQKKAIVITVPEAETGYVEWKSLLKALGAHGIVRLLIEGGGEVLGSAFKAHAVSEAYFVVAPKIIGSDRAIGSVRGEGFGRLGDAPTMKVEEVRRLGDDVLIHGVF